ncbi:hypothetical protein C4R89_00665 [Clostridioides difficile]|nr:hypothetical protein [Clostridioides difficile]MDB0438048.1 hypothetical protein [Clostridioides difficile]
MKENKLLQRGRYFNSEYFFDEFNPDWNKYDFEKIFVNGVSTVYGLKADGSLYICGANGFGAGEIRNIMKDYDNGILYHAKEFTKIDIGVTDIKKVVGDSYNTLILTNSGEVYGAGMNYYAQLGMGDRNVRNTFSKLSITDVKDIECKGQFTVALKNDNTVWGTGNAEAQPTQNGNTLGLGSDFGIKLSFTKLPIEDVSYIKAITSWLFAIKTDGTVWGTGNNSNGQLGIGSKTSVTTFTKIGIDNVKEICGGVNHTAILKNDNTLWTSGASGKLGNGENRDLLNFTSVATDVKQVITGYSSTIIIKLDNTVWGCGTGSYMGTNNSNGTYYSFIKLEDLYDIKYMLANAYVNYAVTNSNKIYFTGNNRDYTTGCKDFINDDYFYTWNGYKDSDYIGYNKSINVGNTTYLLKEDGDYLIFNKGDKLACSNQCTFILKNNGTLYGTGFNAYYELGLGNSNKVTTFTYIAHGVKDIICGGNHIILIKYDGTVWGIGKNDYGQLGIGNYNNVSKFYKINIDNVKQVSCGANYTAIIKNDGTLWVTGDNDKGQLGLNHTTSVSSFTKVDIDNVKQVSCGLKHTAIIKYDGSVYGTGSNSQGQLGFDNTNVYKIFTILNINNVKQIECYNETTLVLKNDNTLHGTGRNSYGELGLGNTTSPINTFKYIRSGIKYICRSSSSSNHTLIIDTEGVISGTGINSDNQIADSSTSNLSNFNTTVCGYVRVNSAVAGDGFTFILKYDNEAIIRGRNTSGQLGNGELSNVTYAKVSPWMISNSVTNFTNNFKIVCSHNNNTFLINNKGEVYSTGDNNNFELGLGPSMSKVYKFNITNVNNVKNIAVRHDHSVVLKTGGEVYGAGSNSFNPLGNTISTSGSVPNFIKISDISKYNIVQISAGTSYTLALTDTGNVYGAGRNENGSLGLGHSNLVAAFTRLPINDVKYICAGLTSSYIVKNDGTLWVTGYNNVGQLGLGHNDTIQNFTKVDINDVKEIVCGDDTAFVIKTDNTVWGTGKNSSKQLGLGDNINRNIFTKINIDNVKQVSCGYSHTMFLKYDDTLWGIGTNTLGELGLGHVNPVTQITQITQFTQIKDVACGVSSTIIILNDGRVLGVGANINGQLGLPSDINSTPEFKDIFASKVFDFDKINSIITNTNFNLINNEYIIATKDVINANHENSYDLDYNKLLGCPSAHPLFNTVFKIPVENIKEFWMSKTHTLIVNTEGELYGRGLNTYGQLLNPLSTSELTSFTKLNFDNVKQASAGTGFSYFVKNDGTLYSVGLNGSFQLGLGHNNEVSEPQRVPGIANVKKVMCDHNFTLVLLNDNTLWAQGYNRNGNFGLGVSKANQTIIEFTKIADNVDDVEINYDYILLRKTDNTVYISGKIRDHYKVTGNDTTVFNKIGIPDFVKPEDLTWVNPLNEETTVMIYKTHTMNSTIEIIEKSISGFKVKIDDIGNPIIKIEMYINNELITTMTEFTNKVVAFSIPLDKIKLGVNNVVFKGYDDYSNNMYTSAIINKENNAICVAENSNLLINSKRYTVKSITDTENKITVTLDRELEGNINVGDIIYQLINNLKVQIKTNNTGMHKDAKLLEIKKVDTGYQEIYEFKEDGMKEVEPKIVVNGDEGTAIKRPSMIFSINESML